LLVCRCCCWLEAFAFTIAFCFTSSFVCVLQRSQARFERLGIYVKATTRLKDIDYFKKLLTHERLPSATTQMKDFEPTTRLDQHKMNKEYATSCFARDRLAFREKEHEINWSER
jgi:hypothetical protein